LIGLAGLLLVVSHVFAVPVLVIWAGLGLLFVVSHLFAVPILVIWAGLGFAISSLSPICSPNFSYVARADKSQITKLGCEKYFCKAHTAGDALNMVVICPCGFGYDSWGTFQSEM
jgi:hypothetical protein